MSKGDSKEMNQGQQQKVGVNNRGILQIAVSESNKRSKVHVPNAMQAFRLLLHKLTKLREE